ncbi:DUF11 domain-containing protein [Marinicella meishanensis]|uniref:DUF11 domain-containing protein n=1 Tax=Marinicella meishanensis TaxID=2873263 RepID=UPI001CBBD9D4|nr:DUF11 domain-containing protein [Marinicella sp. NBU2979]
MKKIVTAVSAMTLTLQANDALSKQLDDEILNIEFSKESISAGGAELLLLKSVDLTNDADNSSSVTFGDTLTYSIDIVNTETFNASGVFLSDTLSSRTVLDNDSITTSQGVVTTGSSPGDRSLVIDVGTIQDRSLVEIRFDTVVNSTAYGPITNQAVLISTNFPSQLSDNPDTPAPDDPTEILLMGEPVDVPVLNKPVGILALILSMLLAVKSKLFPRREQ